MAKVTISEETLRQAIADPRYRRSWHPESEAWRRWVQDGFEALYPKGSTDTAGQRTVQVRAYTRVVDGEVQHVDAYTQTRSGAEGDQAVVLAQNRSDQRPDSAAAQVPRPVIIMIGGADDQRRQIVYDQMEKIRGDGMAADVRYFGHDQRSAIDALIESLPRGTRITVVGHSWGADTAAEIAAGLGARDRQLDVLVTVDPVSLWAGPSFFRRTKRGAARWINVHAVGGDPLSRDNQLADAGGRYGEGPRGIADTFIAAPLPHEAFGQMLQERDPSSGQSLADIIRGR